MNLFHHTSRLVLFLFIFLTEISTHICYATSADSTKPQSEGDALFARGEGLYKANKYDSSIVILKEALRQFEKEKNPERQMMSLVVLGRNYT